MGHGVVLSGEAGIGKSRLVQVLKEHVAGEAHTRWECRCSPYYQHTALYPIIDLLQRALRWQPEDTAEERLTTLEYMLRQYRLLFKHALIQDVAYQSLLKSTRQHYHQRIAQALEARFPEVVATQPELLAHHYVAGGYIEQTVTYWQRAGEQASDRAAHVEAVSHFTTGIELLTTLPETPAHTQQALTLYIALGAALQITKGQGAPEVEHAYTRAHALCQQVGETPEIVPTLLGLWRFYNQRAHFHTARDLGDTLLRLGQQADDRTLAVIAHYALGVTLFCWARCLPPVSTPRQALPSTRQTSAVRRYSALAKIWMLAAESMPLGPSGYSGTRRKP